jgi:hypothetical protein
MGEGAAEELESSVDKQVCSELEGSVDELVCSELVGSKDVVEMIGAAGGAEMTDPDKMISSDGESGCVWVSHSNTSHVEEYSSCKSTEL